jgi:hypothetical protein
MGALSFELRKNDMDIYVLMSTREYDVSEQLIDFVFVPAPIARLVKYFVHGGWYGSR